MKLQSPLQHPFARSLVTVRTWPFVIDVGVAACLLATFFAIVHMGQYWMGTPIPVVPISHSVSALPVYAFYSMVRIGIAYLLSLCFAISYGYIAAYNPRVEAWMIGLLDILQSIPVLSFLPPVVLAMVALVPGHQLGIELGVILLIFTGQVWNLAFSFYSSLKSIPKEMLEASRIYRYSAWQRFWQLEMPNAAIGLVWNSIVSVAGGWFALIACEMFTMGDRNFQLPGLGSYLQTATASGDVKALLTGIAVVILIVVATDQLIWRPLIAWSDKFKFENVESANRVTSPVLDALRNSRVVGIINRYTFRPVAERFYMDLGHRHRKPQRERTEPKRSATAVYVAIAAALLVAIGFAAFHAVLLLREINRHEFLRLLAGAGLTFARVNGALLIASLWTIPVGVAIGFNPRLSQLLQPIAQIAASFPATALFPLILIALARIGVGLGLGSVALMLLAAQWYVLFNVIAGAQAIPSELREIATLFRFSNLQRWTTVILPGIFPFLITGLITASGGAWNASIVAEYFQLKGRALATLGLGAQISAASDQANYPVLLAATMIMALMVVTINRLVWRPLYHLAETKYRLD